LLCERDTPWEDVLRLILRWATGDTHGRAGRLYCLAHADALPLATQLQAATAIRDGGITGRSPLAVITVMPHDALVCSFFF